MSSPAHPDLPARALAPAKINLGLFLGPTREDGKHELVTVMQSISLADELTLEWAPAGVEEDEVLCPGVSGPPVENLAAAALRAFREATSWGGAPLRLKIDKRIPVAAGLGGGSADAAGALRLARHASGLGSTSCCASWEWSWAQTCRRRSRLGAGWRRALVRCWSGCRTPTRSGSAC